LKGSWKDTPFVRRSRAQYRNYDTSHDQVRDRARGAKNNHQGAQFGSSETGKDHKGYQNSRDDYQADEASVQSWFYIESKFFHIDLGSQEYERNRRSRGGRQIDAAFDEPGIKRSVEIYGQCAVKDMKGKKIPKTEQVEEADVLFV
jgi:hypothetical protein